MVLNQRLLTLWSSAHCRMFLSFFYYLFLFWFSRTKLIVFLGANELNLNDYLYIEICMIVCMLKHIKKTYKWRLLLNWNYKWLLNWFAMYTTIGIFHRHRYTYSMPIFQLLWWFLLWNACDQISRITAMTKGHISTDLGDKGDSAIAVSSIFKIFDRWPVKKSFSMYYTCSVVQLSINGFLDFQQLWHSAPGYL